jgi:hypothetical protein
MSCDDYHQPILMACSDMPGDLIRFGLLLLVVGLVIGAVSAIVFRMFRR